MTDEERKALVEIATRRAAILHASTAWGSDENGHLIDRLLDIIEADDQRIAELEREVERRTYDGVHTCHDQCQRVACVLRRRIAELEGWKAAEEAHHHLLKRRIAELEATIREITGV